MSLRQWVVVGTVVVIVGSVVIVAMAYAGWTLGLGTHDRGVTVTVALTADALFAGLVATVLALSAYWAASGTADLHVELTFNYSKPNEPVFKLGTPLPGTSWRPIEPFKQNRARVVVYNRSKYSARNASVQIRLRGFMNVQPVPGWLVISSANMVGATAFQWDGGADQLVHEGVARVLREFTLIDAQVDPASTQPLIVVTVVADGVKPKPIMMPVRALEPDEWSKYMQEIGIQTFTV
ncbi:MAG TPA: hypothetical protein VGS97_25100 [Actinocrinis sp.]|nr:hypothetical protein [Actinocrinis sp.]